jgi:hypothetical protein
LAARAYNDDDEDGRIIVEETREKTRRGRQQGNRLVHHGHVRQYVHRCGLVATMTVSAPTATTREYIRLALLFGGGGLFYVAGYLIILNK